MSRKQDRTGRLLLGRRAAMAAFAALFYITGCTRQTYDSIRLCETTAEQLPALMGGKSQEIRNWRVVSEGTLLLLHHGTVAALTDVRGHILAKVMTEKSTMHWLLFATDSWEERAELRLSTNELEQLKQDFARLQRPIPTSSPQSQPTSTQPTGGLLFDLSGQPSTLAELLTAPI